MTQVTSRLNHAQFPHTFVTVGRKAKVRKHRNGHYVEETVQRCKCGVERRISRHVYKLNGRAFAIDHEWRQPAWSNDWKHGSVSGIPPCWQAKAMALFEGTEQGTMVEKWRAPMPPDPPKDKVWQCPDCNDWNGYGAGARFHRVKTGHAAPKLASSRKLIGFHSEKVENLGKTTLAIERDSISRARADEVQAVLALIGWVEAQGEWTPCDVGDRSLEFANYLKDLLGRGAHVEYRKVTP